MLRDAQLVKCAWPMTYSVLLNVIRCIYDMSARAVRYGVLRSIFKNWNRRASFRRRIFKPRADRRQRAPKNGLVSLNGRYNNLR